VFAGGEVAMPDFLQTPSARLVLFLAATAILITVGAYLVARVRARFRESPPPANELLTNFRELHSKGELSDEEYRTIKSMLAERLQEELTNKVKEG
jgi:uncharacterized membrane protein